MHVAITGASTGIGEALARAWAARGASITLVARRRAAMESLASDMPGTHHVAAWDLSDATRCTGWLDAAVDALGPIDALVNNAGVQHIEPTAQMDCERGERLLALNLHTPLRLVRAVLPGMVTRRSGAIVNIASMAALAPTAGMTYYNASKGAIAAVSKALRGELAATGVHVVTVYPGIVTTQMGESGLSRYASTRLLDLQPRGDAATLASHVVRAVDKRQPRVI
jgi:short-subunit dehydrogenase